jgi:hypothetical protein
MAAGCLTLAAAPDLHAFPRLPGRCDPLALLNAASLESRATGRVSSRVVERRTIPQLVRKASGLRFDRGLQCPSCCAICMSLQGTTVAPVISEAMRISQDGGAPC